MPSSGTPKNIVAEMTALSVGDLSNDGPSSWKETSHEYANLCKQWTYETTGIAADHAQMLVRAFENLILPIIHSNVPASDLTTDCVNSSSNLGPETEQLLDALKTFVTAIVRSQLTATDHTESNERGESVVTRLTAKVVEPSLDGMTEIAELHTPNSDRKPVLKLVLEEAHHYIFNQMPIRLLTFKEDGSGIELMERSSIWHRISTKIKNDFDERKVKSEIYDLGTSMDPDMTEAQKQKAGVEFLVSKYTSFVILSHTWLHDTPGEVTYADWQCGKVDVHSRGYRKLASFCKVAAEEYNIYLGWMDTVCINKESSSELDESIRSMYRWYLHSYSCITYLADTTTLQHMRHDTWFTRGWTLQELLAPHCIKFYGSNWRAIVPGFEDDKANPLILEEICAATSITPEELDHDIGTIPISRRMQWAANRRVTREEDTAYSLMGIFGVSISTAYGEGSERAFVRLVKEILTSGTECVLDILNWGCGDEYRDHRTLERTSVLIPSSPKEYLWRAKQDVHWYSPTNPITLTHLGLQVPVLLMLGSSVDPYAPDEFRPIGNYYASAKDVAILSSYPISCHDYHILEMTPKKQTQTHRQEFAFFGVLNLLETANAIELPDQGGCFAVPLGIDPPPTAAGILPEEFNAGPILTARATVFNLRRFGTDSFVIPKNELQKHGMTLRTLYL